MRKGLGVLTAALLVAGCPGEPPRRPPGPPLPAGEPPTALPPSQTDGRLPPLAAPTHYALDLEIDPAQARFRGTARIKLRSGNQSEAEATDDQAKRPFHSVHDFVAFFTEGKSAAAPLFTLYTV